VGLALLSARLAWAQPADALPGPADSASVRRGATLEVSLLTMGWGDLLWERFGHNAIRVRDAASGFDMSYNWGMFDFDQPNFLARFLTGDTRYWMAAFPTTPLVESYRGRGRAVREQRLALTPGERGALLAFLEWNEQEAHRFYRYDYYRDNCSTRARDALDRVLGGALRAALTPVRTTSSWRSSTERLTAPEPLAYAGISIALGRAADRPLSAWDEAFLPVRFARAIDTLTLVRAGGVRVPLVEARADLVPATLPPEPEQPPPWRWWKSLAVAAVVWALVWVAARSGPRLAALLTAAWYLPCGLLGTALLLAGTVTKHAPYMGSNASLLLVNPLHLVLAVLLPLACLRAPRAPQGALVQWTRRLALASTGLALLTPVAFTLLQQAVLPVGAIGPLHLVGPIALGAQAMRGLARPPAGPGRRPPTA
jgi:hypothetical protein